MKSMLLTIALLLPLPVAAAPGAPAQAGGLRCLAAQGAIQHTSYRPSAVAPCCQSRHPCGQLLTTVTPLARPRLKV